MPQYKFFDQERFDDFDMFVLSFPCTGRHWNELVLIAYMIQHYHLDQYFHISPDLYFYEDATHTKMVPFEKMLKKLKDLHVRLTVFSHDMTPRDIQCATTLHPEIITETKDMIDHDRSAGYLDETTPDEEVFNKHAIFSYRALPWQKLDWDRSHYEGKKVVLRTRNIKDTMVSFYYHLSGLQTGYGHFQGGISEFIRNEEHGAKRALTFLKIWEENKHVPERFLHVEYEQLHADPLNTFKSQLDLLLEGPVNEEYLLRAVELGSFDNMRKLEEDGKIFGSEFKADKGAFKVREGKVGKYKEHLSAQDIDYLDMLVDEMGNPFGVGSW